MQHLGYTMQVCHACKDVTKHRIIEMRVREGTAVMKVCCKCSPEPQVAHPVSRSA